MKNKIELIDKATVIAKIEKRMKENREICTAEGSGAYYEDGFLLDIINSLEVKEIEERTMTQQDKQLLLVDICARLSYGVICYYEMSDTSETMLGKLSINTLKSFISNKPLISEENQYKAYDYSVTSIKPYFRPMSSMTDVERKEYGLVLCDELSVNSFDWLNAHHFDYRGLIDKGLAIEVTKENNPY